MEDPGYEADEDEARRAADALKEDPCSIACRRNCEAGCLNVSFQIFAGVLFFIAALWLADFLLHYLQLTGVSGAPPGLLYGR